MKAKYFFLCLAIGAMALFNVSCDDDVTPSDVPAAVMTKFQQMFPNIMAKWEKDKNGQLKAEFYSDYHEMEVWFQKDGELHGSGNRRRRLGGNPDGEVLPRGTG